MTATFTPSPTRKLVLEFELPADTDADTLEQFGLQMAAKLDELARQLGGGGLRLTNASVLRPSPSEPKFTPTISVAVDELLDDVAILPPSAHAETWRLTLVEAGRLAPLISVDDTSALFEERP